jgi:tetratricopeptide (TPR) repeat protein
MDSPVILIVIGFLYVLVFGGLSLLRKEGLSMRFAFESVIITLLVAVFSWATGTFVHPAIFLFVLYLATMRVRWLVDLGNLFARRKKFATAERIYSFAERLWPDPGNRAILSVNRGTLRLQQGALDEAILILKQVLQQANLGFLGIRYESAAHYNLGVAYQRKGQDAQSLAEFTTVLDIWPVSEYARAASRALERHQQDPDQKTGD